MFRLFTASLAILILFAAWSKPGGRMSAAFYHLIAIAVALAGLAEAVRTADTSFTPIVIRDQYLAIAMGFCFLGLSFAALGTAHHIRAVLFGGSAVVHGTIAACVGCVAATVVAPQLGFVVRPAGCLVFLLWWCTGPHTPLARAGSTPGKALRLFTLVFASSTAFG